MKAIVSCHHYPDDERIYYKQVQSLAKRGNHILYFTRSDSNLNLTDEYINHQNFSLDNDVKTFIGSVSSYLQKQNSLTHIQIHETDLLPVLKNIKSKGPNITTIYDVHEHMEALYRTFSNRFKPVRELAIHIRKREEKKYLKYVDQIILANPPILNNPYENYSIPIYVIENFPELKYLNHSPGLKQSSPAIVYHGHLGPERGIGDLIKAMHRVILSIPEARLTLIGTFRTDEFQNEMRARIQEYSIGDVVQLLNQVPHKDIWDILQNHSIGVIPFRRTPLTKENTPTKLFEMMASGLEIVATDLPPTRYFVDDSIHWASPGDAESIADSIINACQSLGDTERVQKNLKLIAQKYNWDQRQDQYLALFD